MTRRILFPETTGLIVDGSCSILDFNSLCNVSNFHGCLNTSQIENLEYDLRNTKQNTTVSTICMYQRTLNRIRDSQNISLLRGFDVSSWKVMLSRSELLIAPCLTLGVEDVCTGISIEEKLKIVPVMVINSKSSVNCNKLCGRVSTIEFCAYSVDCEIVGDRTIKGCNVRLSPECCMFQDSDELYFSTFTFHNLEKVSIEFVGRGEIDRISFIQPTFHYLDTDEMLYNLIKSFLPRPHEGFLDSILACELLEMRAPWVPRMVCWDIGSGVLMSVKHQFALFDWTSLYFDIWRCLPMIFNSMQCQMSLCLRGNLFESYCSDIIEYPHSTSVRRRRYIHQGRVKNRFSTSVICEHEIIELFVNHFNTHVNGGNITVYSEASWGFNIAYE